MNSSAEILRDLLRFPTVSRDSNLALIDYVEAYLARHGVASMRVPDETGQKANLHAVIGPADRPGVMLSGHTDVVPVEGQAWSVDPFDATLRDGRLFGRGSADMKGFIACVLAAVPLLVRTRLARPVHMALSYDEEVGCMGARRLISVLREAPVKPAFCIVGEPTSMQIVVAHKGKLSLSVEATGRESHSSLAPQGLNAIYLALDLVTRIRGIQADLEREGAHDDAFSVPWTTLHVGTIDGGTALNIVPNRCRFEFEIRNTPPDEPEEILNRIRSAAAEIEAAHRDRFPEARLELAVSNFYPPLDTAPDEPVVAFMRSLLHGNSLGKADYGTEAGLFSGTLGVPTVVCGPGDITQAHKPDEWVALEQLARCDAFLAALTAKLAEAYVPA